MFIRGDSPPSRIKKTPHPNIRSRRFFPTPMSTDRPTPIAIAVVEHDGRFLVGRRAADSVLGGMWEFPGGKIRTGETPEQAAARECLEETGLSIRVAGLHSRIVHCYAHGAVELHFFTGTPDEPDIPPRESFRWIARAELPRLQFPEANGHVIDALCDETAH